MGRLAGRQWGHEWGHRSWFRSAGRPEPCSGAAYPRDGRIPECPSIFGTDIRFASVRRSLRSLTRSVHEPQPRVPIFVAAVETDTMFPRPLRRNQDLLRKIAPPPAGLARWVRRGRLVSRGTFTPCPPVSVPAGLQERAAPAGLAHPAVPSAALGRHPNRHARQGSWRAAPSGPDWRGNVGAMAVAGAPPLYPC